MLHIEAFYTGGGIWIAEADLDNEHYAAVSSEYPDCFSIYKKVDNEDEKYLPEDMVLSERYDMLDPTHRAVYDSMRLSLAHEVAIG